MKKQLLKEQFQRLAGIKPLYEQGDDTFFKDVFGDDDEEFDGTSSKAIKLITNLRQNYRNMSDEELDKFSVEMVEHFLDNIAAQERAKIILTRKGII